MGTRERKPVSAHPISYRHSHAKWRSTWRIVYLYRVQKESFASLLVIILPCSHYACDANKIPWSNILILPTSRKKYAIWYPSIPILYALLHRFPLHYHCYLLVISCSWYPTPKPPSWKPSSLHLQPTCSERDRRLRRYRQPFENWRLRRGFAWSVRGKDSLDVRVRVRRRARWQKLRAWFWGL